MKVTLDLSGQYDVINQRELREALAEDARARAVLPSVKNVDVFWNLGMTGGLTSFTTPPGMVAAGWSWAVMAAGFELSAAGQVRIYKQAVPAAVTGAGRFITQVTGSTIDVAATFAKGQVMLRAGDQLGFFAFSASINSVFLSTIQCPAERIGELLL